jgi:hypothetical protein
VHREVDLSLEQRALERAATQRACASASALPRVPSRSALKSA